MTDDVRPEVLKAAAILELQRRMDEERLRYYQRPLTHFKQRALHASPKRFRGALGGNRTGKTISGAVETVLYALGSLAEPYVQGWLPEDQEWWYRRFAHDHPSMREQVWAATVNWDVHRDVLQEVLLQWLPKGEIVDIAWRRKGVMDFIQTSGRRITFKSYETGADGFQGASLVYIWLDEEPPLDIWNECEKRVMDRKGSVLLTFTPLNGFTWSHDRIYLNANNDPETFCLHMSWDDNPYLDEKEKQRLIAQMDPKEIEARVHGRYLVMGQSVFDELKLIELRHTLSRGTQHQVPKSPHTIEVWEPPQPRERYVIGLDIAEGLPSGDNSALCVLNVRTGQQVAELATNRLEPVPFAELALAVGRWYNTALLVPERNNDGKVVIQHVLQSDYPALYHDPTDQRWGFQTTGRTRPILVAEAQDMLREAPEVIRSPLLVDECLTFVRDGRGRPQAAGKRTRGGKKDDRIFAWALALWGRQWAGDVLPPVRPRKAFEDREYATAEDWVAGSPVGERREFARWDPQRFVRLSRSE